jgi:hypothetical protein
MKRETVWIIGLAFLFCALAFAGDQAVKGTPRSEPAKATAIKVVKMKVTGKVIDVTDTMLKIEHTIKGSVETIEFALEKHLTNIKVGDKIIISYIIKDEKKVATKITIRGPKLIKKSLQPKEEKEPNIPPVEESVPAK